VSATIDGGTVELVRARNAVVVAFGLNGLCFAAWLSRAPAARDALSLTTGQLGLLLLCLSGGACVALPMSGPAVHRLGAARVVLLGSCGVAIGLLGFAAGLLTGSVWPAAAGLVLTGICMSNWDVAMNLAGAEVEQRRGRILMPRLHAAFSVGTVAGGGVGAASSALEVPLAVQVVVAAVLAPAVLVVAVRSFLPAATSTSGDRSTTDPGGAPNGDPAGRADSAEPAARPDVGSARPLGLRAWREPRTLLIGLSTLAFAFTEGSANDWLAVALVDGHHTDEVLGAIGFGVFVSAMTIGRFGGGALVERFGRVPVLRVTALLAVAGLLLVLLGSSLPWVLGGALLWGLGASLGFPLGMSAAADDPARAAARVGVVSSIAYTAFLAGPPLIGVLAQHAGILRALYVVLGATLVGLLVAGAVRPLGERGPVPSGQPDAVSR
jgi:MFS family permease